MDSLFRQANKHLPARGKVHILQRYKRKVDITMKYRIVKNGLGEYAAAEVRWVQLPPHGEWFPIEIKPVSDWYILQRDAENWIKVHTWEVVE